MPRLQEHDRGHDSDEDRREGRRGDEVSALGRAEVCRCRAKHISRPM